MLAANCVYGIVTQVGGQICGMGIWILGDGDRRMRVVERGG